MGLRSQRVIALGIGGAIVATLQLQSTAQIIPDNTLGSERTSIAPNTPIRGLPGTLIQGGAARGANLFHSFAEFNVGEAQRVYFANPIGIANILSRVTGANPSRILGTLGVDGAANLFLLNPNGILFGPNARLDVAGSFVATTADRFVFGNGLEFGATNPQAPPLLTMNIRPGLQYGATSPATIANAGNLTVGQDLTLAAANLDLQGHLQAGGDLTLRALDTLRLRDSVTTPLVVAAGGQLALQGDRVVDIFALNHPNSGLFAGRDLVLRSANTIGGDAHYYSGGNFQIEKLDGSLGNLYSPYDPVIRASGDVSFFAYEGASLHIFAGGSVNIPGYVWIQSPDALFGLPAQVVELANGARVPIAGQTEPTLDIRAGTTDVAPPGAPGLGSTGTIFPPAAETAPPTSANITIGTILFANTPFDITTGTGNLPLKGRVLLTNQYRPNLALVGDIQLANTLPGILAGRAIVNGDFSGGGNIDLHSRGNIRITGIVNADPASFPLPSGNVVFGNGGDVTLRAAGDITLTPGALINSTGVLGGNISVTSGGTVSASGPALPGVQVSGFVSFSVGPAPTNLRGGDITVRAGSLFLDQASIITSTIPLINLIPSSQQRTAEANAGNISIQVADRVRLTGGSQIRGLIEAGGIGKAADIEIQARSLEALGGSQIGTALFREVRDPQGNLLLPGAQGSGGTIRVTTTDQVVLSGINSKGFASGLIALTERGAAGNAGDVFVNTGNFRVENGAVVTTSARGISGDGGKITIQSKTFAAIAGGKIQSNTDSGGQGGDIEITATDRLTISGADANFANRINTINANLQGGTRVDDVLGGVLFDNSGVFANTTGTGTAGKVTLSSQRMDLSNRGFVFTGTLAAGNGNDVQIRVQTLNMTGGAEVVTATNGAGTGGNILVDPLDPTIPSTVNISGFAPFTQLVLNGVSVAPDGRGVLNFEPDGGFSSGLIANAEANTTNESRGGTIVINNISALRLDNGGVLSARTRGAATGGNILVNNAGTIDITGGGQINTAAFSTGPAGNILITATGDINFAGTDPTWQTRKTAIQTAWQTLGLSENDAKTRAEFTVDPASDRSGLQARSIAENGTGSGSIFVTSTNGSISVLDQAGISNSTAGSGVFSPLRFVSLKAKDAITFDNAVVLSQVDPTSTDNGGTIVFEANAINLLNETELQAQTAGSGGSAGNILLTTNGGAVLIDNSRVFSSVEPGGTGTGGYIFIDTGTFTLTDRSELQVLLRRSPVDPSAPNFGKPAAIGIPGIVYVKATDRMTVANRSRIFSTIEEGATSTGINPFAAQALSLFSRQGQGQSSAGAIFLETNRLTLTKNSALTTSTYGTGDAGAVLILAKDTVSLNSGSLILSEVGEQADGIGGGIGLVTGKLTLKDRSQINVNNQGQKEAGDILIAADAIRLDRRSRISATTASGDGGNIGLSVPDALVLRRRSKISTNAGERQGAGTGGNIQINSDFVVSAPLENSDITANAYAGDGGNVSIKAQGIYWMIKRSRADLESLLKDPPFDPDRLPTNDITASSELGVEGEVTIDTPDLDPSRGLVELPGAPVDASRLIAQRCPQTRSERLARQQGTFYIVGRGGLPYRPGDLPLPPYPTGEVRSIPANQAETPTSVGPDDRNQSIRSEANSSTGTIVEAQGWVKDAKGDIWLVADGAAPVTIEPPVCPPLKPGQEP
jgi:filamentous hemagglutinin family protein